jgi:hypothetical protein
LSGRTGSVWMQHHSSVTLPEPVEPRLAWFVRTPGRPSRLSPAYWSHSAMASRATRCPCPGAACDGATGPAAAAAAARTSPTRWASRWIPDPGRGATKGWFPTSSSPPQRCSPMTAARWTGRSPTSCWPPRRSPSGGGPSGSFRIGIQLEVQIALVGVW